MTWFSGGLCCAGLMIGLDALKGFFNLNDSMTFFLNSFTLARLRRLKLLGNEPIAVKEFVVTSVRSGKNAFESQDDIG